MIIPTTFMAFVCGAVFTIVLIGSHTLIDAYFRRRRMMQDIREIEVFAEMQIRRFEEHRKTKRGPIGIVKNESEKTPS